MAVHIHPRNIPPNYYEQIGRIVLGWNLTECFVCSIIWHLHGISDPRVGRLFTYRLDAIKQIEMLNVTLKKYNQQFASELQPWITTISDLRARRNEIVHGLWGRMPEEHETWKMFYHKNYEDMYLLERNVSTRDAIAKIADQIDAINLQIENWMNKNGVPPP